MAVIRGEEAHGEWAWLRLLATPPLRMTSMQDIMHGMHQVLHKSRGTRLDGLELGLDMLRLLSDPEDLAFTDCLDLAEALGQLPEHDHRRDLLSTMQSLAQRLVGASGTNSEVASFEAFLPSSIATATCCIFWSTPSGTLRHRAW